MKKLSSAIVMMLIAGILCACGAKESVQGSNQQVVATTVVASTEAVESQMPTESVAEEGALTYQYTEENFGYSVDVFEGNNVEAGYGFVSYENDADDSRFIYITQYSGDIGDEEQKETLDLEFYEEAGCIGAIHTVFENIQSEILDDLGYEMADYAIDLGDLPIVNGQEMCEGAGWVCVQDVETGLDHNWPVVAYGIASEDTPIAIYYIDRSENFDNMDMMMEKIREIAATYQAAE